MVSYEKKNNKYNKQFMNNKTCWQLSLLKFLNTQKSSCHYRNRHFKRKNIYICP